MRIDPQTGKLRIIINISDVIGIVVGMIFVTFTHQIFVSALCGVIGKNCMWLLFFGYYFLKIKYLDALIWINNRKK